MPNHMATELRIAGTPIYVRPVDGVGFVLTVYGSRWVDVWDPRRMWVEIMGGRVILTIDGED